MFGAGAQGAQLLLTLISVADDPQARALLGGVRDASLRAKGATVLAPSLVK